MLHELSQRLTFTDEQAMLLDTANGFFADKSPRSAVRARIDTDSGFDHALWREMVALGWTGLTIPEAHGGSGLGMAEAVTISEPMGRHLCAAPFLSTQLFVAGLLAAGDETQQARLLPRIADGAVASVALFEEDGDWTLTRMNALARRAGETVELGGAKTLVTDAAAADLLLVGVALEGAPALAIVTREELSAGALARETIIDETRRSYRLTLDGVQLPAERLIRGAPALRALEAVRDTAMLLLSAEAAGGTAGLLELIIEYLNTRTAFGRKIGSYQALKHPCVDMLIGLERSRSHLYHAASLLAGGEDARIALRMAKAQASDTFAFTGDRAIQFHGAFGFTYECDAQLYLRRALWLQYAFGDGAHHRKHLAEALLA